MGLLDEAQILLKKSKGGYDEVKVDGLSEEDQRLVKFVEDRILREAKKGNNTTRILKHYFPEVVLDKFREEKLIVWNNSESTTFIVPIS